jgi:hypothetical protein
VCECVGGLIAQHIAVTFPCMPPGSALVARVWAQLARHTRPARRERESCSTSQKLRHNHAHDSLCVPCHARRGTNLTARPVRTNAGTMLFRRPHPTLRAAATSLTFLAGRRYRQIQTQRCRWALVLSTLCGSNAHQHAHGHRGKEPCSTHFLFCVTGCAAYWGSTLTETDACRECMH